MSTRHQNVLFSHSGGVTTVVNTIAHQINLNTQKHDQSLYIAKYGVHGILSSNYINSLNITKPHWENIHQTPSSCFGSSRARLPVDNADFEPIFKYMDQLKIGTFFCNGGNNSQHITLKMYEASQALGYPLQCIGIPKTIDNDILYTDTCPGFGSSAKYTATALAEISLDVKAMCRSSTNVLIYEAMGRDAGWLAASSALAKKHPKQGPHIILLPEARFSIQDVIQYTKKMLDLYQHCIIVIAEGAEDTDGYLASESGHKSIILNQHLNQALQIKSRIVIPDYLQRCARVLSSKTDIEQSKALATHAFNLALEGQNAIMSTIVRENTEPYRWSVSSVKLSKIAGKVKMLPSSYLRKDQLFVSSACIQFLKPLIYGECFPTFHQGIPNYHPFMES